MGGMATNAAGKTGRLPRGRLSAPLWSCRGLPRPERAASGASGSSSGRIRVHPTCRSSLNTEAWETGGEGKALDLEDDAEEESFADFTHYDEKNEWDEQVYLVGVEFAAGDNFLSNTSAESAQAVQDMIRSGESLRELERLANAAGLQVVGSAFQRLDKPRPATLIGKGKAFQVREEARRLGATTVFFDCELSPSQAKNLDKIMNKKIASKVEDVPPDYLDEDFYNEDEEAAEEDEEDCIELDKVTVGDRTALILDIFSQRAATREGKLQVEMAQAQYQLPRLTRMWTHLERQTSSGGGAAATRGMGETQIEVDKRLLRKRISGIKKELENVRSQRKQFRRKRAKANVPVVALVGYTNAGKSSLLNKLSVTFGTQSENSKKLVKAQDQLFAT